MKIPIYQVDAFTGKLFGGNPAAVCPLESWPDDPTLLNIAAENNLSETAFYLKTNNVFHLRWFTPVMEIDLCGHATLASAWVIFNQSSYSENVIEFQTQSGKLFVRREGEILSMDFPSRKPIACLAPENLLRGLGGRAAAILRSRDYFVVYDSEEEVQALKPDFALLEALDCLGIIVTAKGIKSDFVSRYFAPQAGVLEDPVTGSAHCTLIPYWSERLRKNKLHAYQISKRGGELFCEWLGDRVTIAGRAIKYLEGIIEI